MTAAEADERFAALVAEHRGRKAARPGLEARASDDKLSTLAMLLVYCMGVVAGTVWHVKPLTAVLVGIPLVFGVRFLFKRWRDRVAA